jgi:tetratricopeptide (TPR) repeat protein
VQLPKFPRLIRKLGLLGVCAAALAVGACRKEEPPPPVEAKPVAPPSACRDGRSDDPPRAELVEAQRLFRAQKYADARAALDKMLQAKPKSATALALRGDATLFDDSLGYEAAAKEARGYYERASGILGEGCRVSRRTEYYLHMGDAFAALRLAARDGGTYDATELTRAEEALRRAEQRWPRSAEVHYNLARVHCARPDQLDACAARFEQALEAAESLERPRFLRTHRSTEDWVVRSETQSEFGPLRADPRYKRAIEEARTRRQQAEAGKKKNGAADPEDAVEAAPGEGERRGPAPRIRPDPRPPAQPQPVPGSSTPPK